LAFVYGIDIGVACRFNAAWILWLLGYPDQALKRSHAAITLAQELSHPFSLSFALVYTAELHQFRREWRLAQERAEAALALSAEQGFAQSLSLPAIVRGWALAEQGQGEEGIAQMQQGLAAWRETGAKVAGPYYLALLAEAYRTGGRVAEGLRVVAEARAAVDKTGERLWEAELYRLRGELTLRQFTVQGSTFNVEHSPESEGPNSPTSSIHSPALEAGEYFLKAIAVAQQQHAKSLELRATMSLARLWQGQGKNAEAHILLSDIYGWFTEGFATRDLQDAKALLTELAEER
jgi:predicted ATPase